MQEIAGLSAEPCQDETIIITVFDINKTEVISFLTFVVKFVLHMHNASNPIIFHSYANLFMKYLYNYLCGLSFHAVEKHPVLQRYGRIRYPVSGTGTGTEYDIFRKTKIRVREEKSVCAPISLNRR